jgi:hypothetical protein
VGHDRDNVSVHHIKYRYLDGNTWSEIIDLGELHMHSGDLAFDLRLGVDNNLNVHVVTYKEHDTTVWYVAKYGDTILPVEKVGNPGSRLKHPDIAVDDNYVHMIWMRKIGFPYVIVHQKRENRVGGTRSTIKQITFPVGEYASQKSRIDLDSEGYFHLAEFYKTGIVKKLKYYKELPNGSFTPYVNLSHPEKLLLYHWAGLEVRDNSIIATMQLGSTSGGTGLFYNWKRGGKWGGYSAIPGTHGAVHQSVDLSADGQIAAVAYGRTTTEIMMVSSEPISATGTLETEFTHPAMVFWGSDITFDASQCTTLNPDYTIVSYEWDFGDSNTETTSSPTVTHRYNTYGAEVRVNLTITAESGATGLAYKDIHIHALYNAIITSVTPKRVRTLFYDRAANEIEWRSNPLNENAGYPSITGYELWRAPQSSTLSDDDYVKMADLGTNTTSFLDYFDVNENVDYVYSVLSVDAEGHISPFNHYSDASSITIVDDNKNMKRRSHL